MYITTVLHLSPHPGPELQDPLLLTLPSCYRWQCSESPGHRLMHKLFQFVFFVRHIFSPLLIKGPHGYSATH